MRAIHSWLVALADPMATGVPSGRALSPEAMKTLLRLAEVHGVLPSVVARLRPLSEQAADKTLAPLLETARETLRKYATITLLIRRQNAELAQAFRQADIPAALLKGTDFADRLYPSPALRTFGDADWLIPPACLDATDEAMASLGYEIKNVNMKYDTGYGERAYIRPQTPGYPVEIHWNLVNSPSIRRGVSVAFEDLQFTEKPHAGVNLPTPSALLLLAAVHAAASHSFDRLQPLVDILQCVRGTAGTLDPAWLRSAVARTGASRAMGMALHLTGSVFHETACRRLSAEIGQPCPSWLDRRLITPAVMLRAHAQVDSPRRSIFRTRLKRASGSE
jgi:hypothetical protein